MFYFLMSWMLSHIEKMSRSHEKLLNEYIHSSLAVMKLPCQLWPAPLIRFQRLRIKITTSISVDVLRLGWDWFYKEIVYIATSNSKCILCFLFMVKLQIIYYWFWIPCKKCLLETTRYRLGNLKLWFVVVELSSVRFRSCIFILYSWHWISFIEW